jgi:hypothetical protein
MVDGQNIPHGLWGCSMAFWDTQHYHFSDPGQPDNSKRKQFLLDDKVKT